MAADPGRRSFVAINVPDAERAELRAFVMACAVLGITLKPVNSLVEYRRVDEAGRLQKSVTWFLSQKDPSGKYRTNELYRWWRDPAWLAANPTHPLALLREYSQALKDAEAHENTGALFLSVITRGKRHAHIPKNLDPERKAQLLQMLDQ